MASTRRVLKFFLLKLFHRNLLRIQISAILIIIVTIPVILLGISFVNLSEQAVKNSVSNNHKQIVIRAAAEAGLFIKRPEDILRASAAILSRMRAKAWDQETILVELVLNQPIFIRAFFVDALGREIAISELGKYSQSNNYAAMLKVTDSGKTYISEVKFLNDHTPYLRMAVPIKEKGNLMGALAADVNLRGLWEIADDIKLDKTGRAFLVSNKGVLIAHPDKKRVLKNENLKNEKDVRSVLAGETASLEIQDASGQKWLSSYALITKVGWGIILRQKQEEAYLFFKLMRVQAWAIIILIELGGILLSILIGWFLVRPVKAVVSRIKQTMTGDLEQKIGVKRHDEIGELITSFNKMQGRLKNAKIREGFSIIGESAAQISHELKNSLVPIKSFIQLFARRHKDKDFVDKFNRLIPNEIKRWENMVGEISNFSSTAKLNKTKTDVKELIQNILEIMEEKFREKGISVIYYSNTKNFQIEADEEKLKQVFMNLIINALNAMTKGDSLKFSIDVINSTNVGASSQIEVRVDDSGRGIPPDKLEKIFEPFYTATKGGIGLGLTISSRIIEQHGGSIAVQSKMNGGTTFIIKLPVVI